LRSAGDAENRGFSRITCSSVIHGITTLQKHSNTITGLGSGLSSHPSIRSGNETERPVAGNPVYQALAAIWGIVPLPGLNRYDWFTTPKARRGLPPMRFRVFLLSLASLVTPLFAAAQETARVADNSDWWSRQVIFTNLDLSAPSTNLQLREPKPSNFQIGGVALGNLGDAVSQQFGKATNVVRGDAAYARGQTCYISDGLPQVHLIFEGDGEGFGSSFYLFEDGPNWTGSDFCAKSSRVSANLQTASGVRLGATPSQVQSILGNPSTVLPDRLVYVFEVERKNSNQQNASCDP
jgi:hypothetical protein